MPKLPVTEPQEEADGYYGDDAKDDELDLSFIDEDDDQPETDD